MAQTNELSVAHPKGEVKSTDSGEVLLVDTVGSRMRVEWDETASVTPLGQMVFFSQFLATAGLFRKWVNECPLQYHSGNAPKVVDVLGTVLLSALSGHQRYAHITALRADMVSSRGLGMSRVCSEDSVRRAWKRGEEEEIGQWQRKHLYWSFAPALRHEWVADLDATIKVIYGHQEGAEVGYNPHKPGRPAHVYHTAFVGRLRMALDVEVLSGKRHAAGHGFESWWRLWDRLEPQERPFLVRGDCQYGQEKLLKACEDRKQAYLFRLRQTKGVKELLRVLESSGRWLKLDGEWSGCESQLKLQGWTSKRRVAVLRKKVARSHPRDSHALPWDAPLPIAEDFEYLVLVTNTDWNVSMLAATYRQRADSENPYDELKNQWGWGGYTTKDIKRCQIAARNVALIYNWWTTFVRCAEPTRAREAMTSRPLLLSAIGVATQHAGQIWLRLTTVHGLAEKANALLTNLSLFLSGLQNAAEQLSPDDCWKQIWNRISIPLLPPARALPGPSG